MDEPADDTEVVEEKAEATEEAMVEKAPEAPFVPVAPRVMSKNTRTLYIVIAGIIFILVAMMIRSSYIMLYSDMYDLTGDDRQDRKDALDVVGLVEDILFALGIFIFLIGLLYGSVDNTELPDVIRMGMILAAAIVLGLIAAGAMW